MKKKWIPRPDEPPSGVRTIKEILEYGDKMDVYYKAHNRIRKGWLTLDVRENCGTYDIQLSRIKSHRDLLDWMRQLGEKNWMDKERLLYVINLMAQHCNLTY